MIVSKFDEQVVQRRRVALQHYFKTLVRSPAISCSILYDFLVEGRKGLSQDPNRIKTVKERKKRTIKKGRRTKTPTREETTTDSNTDNPSPVTIKNVKEKSKRQLRKSDPKRATSCISKKDESIVPKFSTPKVKSKKKRPVRTLSESQPSGKKKKTPSGSWTKVIPKSEPNSNGCDFGIGRTSSGNDSLIKGQRQKNLLDLNSMFGDNFYFPAAAPGPTRTTERIQRMQRSSATFYLKKFNSQESALEIEEESDEEDEETLAVPAAIMEEENITKLSDIAKLDFESLGIDDVDLADFELNDDLMDDLTDMCDVDELLNEFGSLS